MERIAELQQELGGVQAEVLAITASLSTPAGSTAPVGFTKPAAADMVWIEPGTFTMGSPENEPGRRNDETQRRVTLTQGFYMGKYEVTQKLYQEVMGVNPFYNFTPFYLMPNSNPRRPMYVADSFLGEGDSYPVYLVDWGGAVEFCNRLSIMEGLTPAYSISGNAVTIVEGSTGYRLPTEAQWEYACRAGTSTAFNWGTNTADDGKAHYGAHYWQTSTKRVGSYAPNAWGLYDMHGNVQEWCWDWYEESPSGTSDPAGPASGTKRVIRGGSLHSEDPEQLPEAPELRSASRDAKRPSGISFPTGIRLVLPKSGEAEAPAVRVFPSIPRMAKGESLTFVARVTGMNNPAQTVRWSIEQANKNSGTSIDSNGRLTVARAETLPYLTIRASSTADPSRYATAVVTIDPKPLVEGMAWIPAGTFMMGSPKSEPFRVPRRDNLDLVEPLHQVTLTEGFYMGRYPVTQDQWAAVMGSNPSYFKDNPAPWDWHPSAAIMSNPSYFKDNPARGETQGRRPVESISWYDAIEFCNRLSVMEGLTPAYTSTGFYIVPGSTGYRLPTEAQWEYAARAGTTTANYLGNTGSDDLGWDMAKRPYVITHEAGLKPANPWGLYDMAGNVFEWCFDYYGDDLLHGYKGRRWPATDPVERSASRPSLSSYTARVVRGGVLPVFFSLTFRSAARMYAYPSSRGGSADARGQTLPVRYPPCQGPICGRQSCHIEGRTVVQLCLLSRALHIL